MGFQKRLVVTALGSTVALLGIWLRLSARGLAWPAAYSYSGPREATEWAIREHAYGEIGIASLAFGLAVLLIVLVHWLWDAARVADGHAPKSL